MAIRPSGWGDCSTCKPDPGNCNCTGYIPAGRSLYVENKEFEYAKYPEEALANAEKELIGA